MRLAWLALLPALLAPGAVQAQVQAAVEAPVVYRVQRGDTLYGLAARYMNRLADGVAVGRLNRVSDPRRLPVGRTLSIPAHLLRTEPIVARLVAYSGPVQVAGPAPLTPALGMELREGYELSTGANAFLTFELPDGSRTTLPSQSRVRIERLRRVVMTGAEQRDLRLFEGRATSTVTPMREPQSRFRILTPVAVSAVRGTDFRARHDANARRSTLEVLEGRVAQSPLEAEGEAVVEAGFGASATAEGVSAPRALLPPPKLARRAGLQDDPQVRFTLEPSPGAVGYRGQIARDAGFIDLIAETTSTAPEVVFEGLPNGGYFVRLTATDVAGLESLPATHAFERRLNGLALEPPSAVPGARRQYVFKWTSTGGAPETFRFILSRGADGADPVIDAPGLTERQIVVTDLPPGRYHWRVGIARREDGRLFEKWSTPQTFEIGP